MNQNFILLSNILQSIWLMDKEYAMSYLPLFASLLKNEPVVMPAVATADRDGIPLTLVSQDNTLPIAVAGSRADRAYYKSFDEIPEGSTSIIRVHGALMKSDYWNIGTATLRNRIKQADAHPNIANHILLIESPGGTVDGTKEFADAIKATTKPVVAFVDGLAASAAYWIASAADEIILSTDTAMIGSIGTMISFMDIRGYFEELGIKFHDIFAEDSSEKNRTFLEALSGNYKPIKEQILNPTNDIFLAAVRENRPGINEKALKGRMYLAADALKMNLADYIGDFDFAMQRLAELSSTDSPPWTRSRPGRRAAVTSINNNQSQKEMFGKNKFTALTAALAVIASLKEGETVIEEHTNAVNDELVNLGLESLTVVPSTQLDEYDTTLESANTQLATANAALATANEQLAAMTAERDKYKILAEKYGAQAGAEHTDLGNGEGDKLEETEANDYQKLIDALPHNQAIDGNPMFNHKKEE